nr:MAG TPA: Prokaryotic metallothionein [Caudoviricetes sp.]
MFVFLLCPTNQIHNIIFITCQKVVYYLKEMDGYYFCSYKTCNQYNN